MKEILTCLTILLFAYCSDRRDHDVSQYLTPAQEQSILDQTVRYMYYGEGIPAASRFDTAYDAKYKRATREFYLDRYFFAASEGTHTFLIVRRYPGEKYRGIVGTLQVDSDNTVHRFKEKLVTPLATQEDVLEKGRFLFTQLVEKGDVDARYYKMKSYIEWPDEQMMYDTVMHEWRRRAE
jgi:hypothetical protein